MIDNLKVFGPLPVTFFSELNPILQNPTARNLQSAFYPLCDLGLRAVILGSCIVTLEINCKVTLGNVSRKVIGDLVFEVVAVVGM